MSHNVEFFVYKLKFEDGTDIPLNFFSELVSEDQMNSWDNTQPTEGSTVRNILDSSQRNKRGADIFTGVFVEATNISREIEIMDLTGRIESATITESSSQGEDEGIEVNETEGGDRNKLIFEFQVWRIGIIPSKGLVAIERRSSNYESKLQEYLSSWSMKWASRKDKRTYKSIKIEPTLTGQDPSVFFGGGHIGAVEFALSSEVLERQGGIFDNDLKKVLQQDNNLVVSVEIKSRRGKEFLPEMTSELVSFIQAYKDNLKKISGKKVVSNRKSRPVDLVNNLMHKVLVVEDLANEVVLNEVEDYLVELFEDTE